MNSYNFLIIVFTAKCPPTLQLIKLKANIIIIKRLYFPGTYANFFKKKSSTELQSITQKWVLEINTHLHDEKTSNFFKLFEFLKNFGFCLFPMKIRPINQIFDHFSGNFGLEKKWRKKHKKWKKNFCSKKGKKDV